MIGQHKGLYQSSGMTWMEAELAKLAPKQQELFGTTSEDKAWCYWCDRPRLGCVCHLDPNGIPAGHWSAQ